MKTANPPVGAPARHEQRPPATPEPTRRPMPCDVFCTVERHPGLARPQGSAMSLAG